MKELSTAAAFLFFLSQGAVAQQVTGLAYPTSPVASIAAAAHEQPTRPLGMSPPVVATSQRVMVSPNGNASSPRLNVAPVNFGVDGQGYGHALFTSLIGSDLLVEWGDEGKPASVSIAHPSLSPVVASFVVRIESNAACVDRGCPMFVFVPEQGQWQSVLETKSREMAVGYPDASGFAQIVLERFPL
jgi:hypothetical protein